MVRDLARVAAFFYLVIMCGVSAGAAKPSVILISLDTVSAGHLDLYGYQRKTMPFLSRLAKSGVVFENNLSAGAYTLPSHMTMFTGVSPLTHQIEINERNRVVTTRKLAPNIKTIAEYFKQNGYKTSWYGPLTDVHLDLEAGFSRGFDEMHKSLLDFLLPPKFALPQMRRLMRHVRARPSFVFLHTYLAHDPYKPMEPFIEMFGKGQKARPMESMTQVVGSYVRNFFESLNPGAAARIDYYPQFNLPSTEGAERLRSLYDGGLRGLDERLEDLFRIMREEKILDSAIVILTSDHGEAFGEHGQYLHTIPFRDLLHVPLIILKKGVKPQRVREATYGADLLPTILELAAIAPAANVEGQSVAPLINGKTFKRKTKFQFARGSDSTAIFDSRWQLIKWENRRTELFDLQSDPAGMTDVAEKNAEVTGRLESELAAFAASRPVPHFKPVAEKPYKIYWFIADNLPADRGSLNLFKLAQAGTLPNFRLMMDEGISGYSSAAPGRADLNAALGGKKSVLQLPKQERAFAGDWNSFMDDERLALAEALDTESPQIAVYRMRAPEFSQEKNLLEIYRGFDRLVGEGLRRAEDDSVVIFSANSPVSGGSAPFFAWGPDVYRGKKLSKPVGASDQLAFGLRLTGHKPSAVVADPDLAAAIY